MALTKINAAEQLMKQVYGDWDVMDMNFFPKPLPAIEAGPSSVKWGEKVNASVATYGPMHLDC